MCSISVMCPLCAQTSFPNIDSLRISLIKAANGPLTCPICQEILLGLDKLTIHLFSHSNLMETNSDSTMNGNFINDCNCNQIKNENNIIDEKCLSNNIIINVSNSNMNSNVNTTASAIATVTAHTALSSSANIKNSKLKNSTSEGDHILIVSQPKCDICGITYEKNDLLYMHNKLVHQNNSNNCGNANGLSKGLNESRYQCHLCAKVFKMKGSLRIHMKVVHLVGLPDGYHSMSQLEICNRIKEQNIPQSSSGGDGGDGGDLGSSLCSIPTVQQSSSPIDSGNAVINGLQISSNNNNNNQSTIIPLNISNEENDLINSIVDKKVEGDLIRGGGGGGGSDSAKIWECDICSKSFTTKYFLKKHKRLHTGEMPYTCAICGKTFTFQQSYHKHLLYHSNEKPHVCQTCGRAFKELSTLHNHERIHSGEKPFKCEICDKCFRQRVSYLVHKRIHTGVMPYKCNACQKSFRYKVSQRTHKCIAQPLLETSLSSSEDILQKLLLSTSILPEDNNNITENCTRVTISPVKVLNPPKGNTNEELLTKSIDEIVAESCNKMGIGHDDIIDNSFSTHMKRISFSPDGFQNSDLYSPSSERRITSHLDTINEDSFKEFLYGVGEHL